jgi:hypothetical protein
MVSDVDGNAWNSDSIIASATAALHADLLRMPQSRAGYGSLNLGGRRNVAAGGLGRRQGLLAYPSLMRAWG